MIVQIITEIEDQSRREDVARRFANLFKKTNPKFNAKKFLKACGV